MQNVSCKVEAGVPLDGFQINALPVVLATHVQLVKRCVRTSDICIVMLLSGVAS